MQSEGRMDSMVNGMDSFMGHKMHLLSAELLDFEVDEKSISEQWDELRYGAVPVMIKHTFLVVGYNVMEKIWKS